MKCPHGQVISRFAEVFFCRHCLCCRQIVYEKSVCETCSTRSEEMESKYIVRPIVLSKLFPGQELYEVIEEDTGTTMSGKFSIRQDAEAFAKKLQEKEDK